MELSEGRAGLSAARGSTVEGGAAGGGLPQQRPLQAVPGLAERRRAQEGRGGPLQVLRVDELGVTQETGPAPLVAMEGHLWDSQPERHSLVQGGLMRLEGFLGDPPGC